MSGRRVSTAQMAAMAEEMATFFEDEKLKAQNRIRKCELFMNDARLQSNSVREGKVAEKHSNSKSCEI